MKKTVRIIIVYLLTCEVFLGLLVAFMFFFGGGGHGPMVPVYQVFTILYGLFTLPFSLTTLPEFLHEDSHPGAILWRFAFAPILNVMLWYVLAFLCKKKKYGKETTSNLSPRHWRGQE